jgi:hypothetical protein
MAREEPGERGLEMLSTLANKIRELARILGVVEANECKCRSHQ